MDIRNREGLIRFLNRLEGSLGDNNKEDIRYLILLLLYIVNDIRIKVDLIAKR